MMREKALILSAAIEIASEFFIIMNIHIFVEPNSINFNVNLAWQVIDFRYPNAIITDARTLQKLH